MAVFYAILIQPYLDEILSGIKTVDSRFTKNRIAPYKKVKIGDILYFKLSGGLVYGKAEVEKVLYFDELTPAKVKSIFDQYNTQIRARLEFIEQKLTSEYATLMWLTNVTRVTPFAVEHHGQSSWFQVESGLKKWI